MTKSPEELLNEFLASASTKSLIRLLQSPLACDKDIIESSLKVAYASGLRDGQRATSEQILGTINKTLNNSPQLVN